MKRSIQLYPKSVMASIKPVHAASGFYSTIASRSLNINRSFFMNDTNSISISNQRRYFSQKDMGSQDNKAILEDLYSGKLSHHKLESMKPGKTIDAVRLRRLYLENLLQSKPSDTTKVHDSLAIPLDKLDGESFYNQVNGANCENVIGYIPIPVGIAGPLTLDGRNYYVPMATTEGALIASTNRGARAISKCGGATTVLLKDGMTRAPALECESLSHAARVKEWIENSANFDLFQKAFQSTTRFGRLESLSVKLAGRLLFVRMRCFTGDAMVSILYSCLVR